MIANISVKKIILIVLTLCAIAAIVILGLLGLGVLIQHKQSALLSQPPEHGVSFVVDAGLPQVRGDTNVLTDLKAVMQRRFDKLGSRIFLESVSESRFRIVSTLVTEKEIAAAQKLISRGGRLEFRLVHEKNDQLVAGGEVPAGYELLKREEIQPSGQGRIEMVVVKKNPEDGLSGNMIKTAFIAHDSLGQPAIDFELTPESAAAFAAVTRKNIGHRLAIVLDGQLYWAPSIQSPIETGNGQIDGHFDEQEAWLLTILIEFPLPVPVTLVESKTF